MKFVLNKCYGGFGLSDWALWKLDIDPHNINWDDFPARDDPDLITLVTNHGRKVSGECAALVVVEIPDNTTDYAIDEYDGFETITYVVDGKLNYA